MKHIAYFLFVMTWVAGIAVTPGSSVLSTIVFPPYAYYQIVRQAMVAYAPELLP